MKLNELRMYLFLAFERQQLVHSLLRSYFGIKLTSAIDSLCPIDLSVRNQMIKIKLIIMSIYQILTTMLFKRPDISSSGISLYHPDERFRLMMSANEVGFKIFSSMRRLSSDSNFFRTSTFEICISFNSNFISSKIAGLRSFCQCIIAHYGSKKNTGI